MSIGDERRRLAVYCASRLGGRPAFAAAATAVGDHLARRGADLVYGGAHVGLMGRVADAAVAGGSHVIGVITDELGDREIAHEGIHDLRRVMDMPARKRAMYDEADAFLALPGGVGTMEELFEILCWAYLGLHHKPVGLLNVEGYYDHLLAFLAGSVDEGLCKPSVLGMLAVDTEPVRLVDRLLDDATTANGGNIG